MGDQLIRAWNVEGEPAGQFLRTPFDGAPTVLKMTKLAEIAAAEDGIPQEAPVRTVSRVKPEAIGPPVMRVSSMRQGSMAMKGIGEIAA